MSEVQPFSHPFFDIEIEPTSGDDEAYFVKVLSVSGHRFTYELHGPLDQRAIDYMKSLLDVACFGDLVIDRSEEGLEARESSTHLKKHS